MTNPPDRLGVVLDLIDPSLPVLIAGPTASGKSTLALALAEAQGGVIVNADAIQVHSDWRILTARPSKADEARARHALYGHVAGDQPYSVGAWLREVTPLLSKGKERVIITGGTGLYFTALTEGLAQIPPIPAKIRSLCDWKRAQEGLEALVAELDAPTRARIDLQNPARVARAWEVLQATGQGLIQWQEDMPPPLLPPDQAQPLLLEAPKDWLTPRIEARFAQMIEQGVLDEARANLASWSADRPSAKAIGARELMAHLGGEISLSEAATRATIQTRQYAKRQRTWFRARMKNWQRLNMAELA